MKTKKSKHREMKKAQIMQPTHPATPRRPELLVQATQQNSNNKLFSSSSVADYQEFEPNTFALCYPFSLLSH
jgi:hypothetical protein